MGRPLGLQSLRDFTGGQNTEVVDSLLPANSMRLIQNMDTDFIGALRVRKGTTAIGDQLQDNKNILGLFNFRDSGSGSNNQQIAGVNNSGDTQAVLKYNNAGTWTNISGGTSFTASAKFRFATFVDYVFIVNSARDAVKSWTGAGATALGTTNLTSAPVGEYITVFKDRLYIASTATYNDRLFFSSVPDATTLAITWAISTDYLDVNPDDGMNITGLANIGSLLLIFKDRALYRWNGSSTDADVIVNYGASSQEGICVHDGIAYFFNPGGIYGSNGGYPLKLSAPIQRWIDAIPGSYYTSVSMGADSKNVYASIGDVTVDSVAYTNVVLVYNLQSQTWTIRTYAEEIKRFANYIESDETENIMIGNDDGDVQRLNFGSTDTGTDIAYRVISKKLDFGSMAIVKSFSDVFVFGEKLPGAKTSIRTEESELYSPTDNLLERWWKRLKGIKNRGRYFILELSGSSRDGQGIFVGWEIVDLSDEGYD